MHPLKKKNTAYTVILFTLVAAIAVYLGVYVIRMLRTPFRSALAVRYTNNQSIEATGYIVRNEEVLTSSSGFVEPAVSSGEKVAADQLIARGYNESQDHSSVREIDALEERLQQIESTISVKTTSSDAYSIENEIFDELCGLAREKNSGTAARTDEYIDRLKIMFLRKVYLYGGAQSLEEAAKSIKSEIEWLKDSDSLSGTQMYADCAGVFSSVPDGYEKHLNIPMLDGMTIEDYKNIPSLETFIPTGAYGKLISSNEWCFVTLTDSESAASVKEGQVLPVEFSGGYDGTIDMTVKRVLPGDGQTLLVLSTNKLLYATADLREQTVEIVLNRSVGIRIPKKAVMMREGENGEPVYGVYVVDGIMAKFKEVTIVSQTGDYYVVAENPSDPYALRAGNEVILTLKDMYEGKVLQ